jgi:2-hydroxychromene-2-carboxylate isomerase
VAGGGGRAESLHYSTEEHESLLDAERFPLDLVGQAEEGVHHGPHNGPGLTLVVPGLAGEPGPPGEDPLPQFGLDARQFRAVPSHPVDQSPQNPAIGRHQREELPGREGHQFGTGQSLLGRIDIGVQGGETVQDQRSIEIVEIRKMFVDPLSTDTGLESDGGHGETAESITADDGRRRVQELVLSGLSPQIGPRFRQILRHQARLVDIYVTSTSYYRGRAEAPAPPPEEAPMAPMAPGHPGQVDFHFDIMCPYAYQTSIWIREVRDLAGIDVRWRFFSLEEINRQEGKKHPWEREWSYGWSMMRIGAYLRRTDMELLDRWYWAAGTALHVEGRKPHRREVAEELLADLGLDPGIVSLALSDPTTGDEVRLEHEIVVDKGAFGVPTLVFADGQALFGPVLIDPPEGEAALRLWDLVTGWLEFPAVYELQRPKQASHITAIAAAFAPYLAARDWQSVQRPTP